MFRVFFIGHGVVIVSSVPMVSFLSRRNVIRSCTEERNIVIVIIYVNERSLEMVALIIFQALTSSTF